VHSVSALDSDAPQCGTMALWGRLLGGLVQRAPTVSECCNAALRGPSTARKGGKNLTPVLGWLKG
jgi:hypothetical protein